MYKYNLDCMNICINQYYYRIKKIKLCISESKVSDYMNNNTKSSKEEKSIKSANWHLTSQCNYRCRFCFAKKLSEPIMNLSQNIDILNKFRALGIEKITFVGGEPLTHPLIFDLVRYAKNMDFTVSITTNGSLLNKSNIKKLAPYVDWIGISIDSMSNRIEKELGRGDGKHVSHVLEIVELIHNAGIRLKVNTTVTKKNYREDMQHLIQCLNPETFIVGIFPESKLSIKL